MSAAVAHARGAASSHEARSWPQDADHSPELSIGRVVDALKEEFPAISLSKVRYLESEGLVAPARTGSGYRKYSAADVERLRYVLTEQRDSFTPLSVIRTQLDALDAGHTPTRRRVAQVVSSEGQTVSLCGRRAMGSSHRTWRVTFLRAVCRRCPLSRVLSVLELTCACCERSGRAPSVARISLTKRCPRSGDEVGVRIVNVRVPERLSWVSCLPSCTAKC